MRRRAKKAAGTKREGYYEYHPANIKTWSIFRGDLVEVKVGEEKGQQALVTRVDRLQGQLFLEGLRREKGVVKRASSLGDPYFGIIQKPFSYDHVVLVDPETKRGARVRWKILENGDRVRYSKDTGTLIPRPIVPRRIVQPSSDIATSREDARRITYEKHPKFLKTV